MVTPDGIAAGKVSAVYEFLCHNDFSVVAVEQPVFTRHVWRELWRYQLTSANLDRLSVNELVFAGPALLLLLRHDGELDVPATVQLSSLKGPAIVALQWPGCLRKILGQPNPFFGFVHVADEPADLVRELGVLLDDPMRRRVLSAASRSELPAVDRGVLDTALEDDSSHRRNLDAKASVEQAIKAVKRAVDLDPSTAPLASHALKDLEQMRLGNRIAWQPFARALAEIGVELDRWDLATLGTSFIIYDEPGTLKIIENVDPDLWRLPDRMSAGRGD